MLKSEWLAAVHIYLYISLLSPLHLIENTKLINHESLHFTESVSRHKTNNEGKSVAVTKMIQS